MDFTPKEVQAKFTEGDDGPCYLYWKEMSRTRVWYDESDNTFHTDLDINIIFEGYELECIEYCLDDLIDKIIEEMGKRGITIHPAHPVDSYESDHEELVHIVIEEMKRRGCSITYETIRKLKNTTDFTPKDVQAKFKDMVNGQEHYIYWKEVPRTKVWYDESDNTFHSNIGINLAFEGYNINEVISCFTDLLNKIEEEMKKRGVHGALPYDSYESDHEELVPLVIEEMRRRGRKMTYETIQKLKEQS